MTACARSDRPSWPDDECLEALHLRDVEGWSYGMIGKSLARTRSACIAMLSRIDKDTDASDPDGNGNGTMPVRWWS